MSVTPFLLDTDIGTDVDDAIALALALASPELQLRAVTTVSGDVRLRARGARKLLTLAGAEAIPVAAGVQKPILQRRNFLWLGHEGKGIVDDSEPLPIAAPHGVDLLIEMVLRERVPIVAIGPLSNLAVAIMKEPQLAATIPHLTLMGGVLGLQPGSPALEYNLGSDAEASVLVLDSGIPTTIVPLDVTLQTFFTDRDLARLRTARSPLVQTVCDAMEIWWPLHQQFLAGERHYGPDVVCFLHDPLALSLLIDPSFLRLDRLRLTPEVVDGNFHLRRDPSGREFQVATEVDAPAFVEFIIERLMNLA